MGRAKITSHTLQFQNPVFGNGSMITVRKGPKWSKLVAPGLHIDIEDVSNPDEPGANALVSEAFIEGVLLTTFEDIPREILKRDHDPGCRTTILLFREMQKIYGPDFKMTDIVTVVFFRKATE